MSIVQLITSVNNVTMNRYLLITSIFETDETLMYIMLNVFQLVVSTEAGRDAI